ncbi:DinB family protein [Planococcus sp. FY231025]|uniref:DinB family protein n=1 Tax=Planococcus sp. FY231025 TaxID=3455699 RepID=UPI003F91ABC6
MEKGEVVKVYKEYEQYLSALAASCRPVEDVHAPIAEGKWSVAEIVMHLAEWDRYIREQRLPGMIENARLEGAPDVGRFNEVAAAKAASMEFEEVISYAQRERALLRKAVDALSPEE